MGSPKDVRYQIMKRFNSAVYAVSVLLATGCSTPEAPDAGGGEQSSDTPLSCVNHVDCPETEICMPNQQCELPWGKRFVLSELRFEGPSSAFESRCSIVSRWYPQESSGESIQFRAGQWNEPAHKVWYLARPDSSASVVIDFFPVKKGDECPSHGVGGPLCLSDACEPFEVGHYRGSHEIRLTNATGDALKFRLRPM